LQRSLRNQPRYFGEILKPLKRSISSRILPKEFTESSEPKYPFKRLRRFGIAMVNRHQAWVIVSHSESQSAMHIWTREPTIGFPLDVGSGGKYLSIKLGQLPLFALSSLWSKQQIRDRTQEM
jgi:hypothetical protein